MNNGINIQNCTTQQVFNEKIKSREVIWDVLRLDRIHPQISGNKYFKLKYTLPDAKNNQKPGLLTFGGAWSNHLLATASIANIYGLRSIGFVRGEKPAIYSPTLIDAKELGMELKFLSREEYRRLSRAGATWLEKEFPSYAYIAEGGYSREGAIGASSILNLAESMKYDWIVAACGTGTTIAGLLMAAKNPQRLLGVSVLKHHQGLRNDIETLVDDRLLKENLFLEDRFHFGGYAKCTPELLGFMNGFYREYSIPTDFVYTGKLMFAVNQLIEEGWFTPGSRILTIHSGGLQGNRSLKPGDLSF